MCTTVNWPHVYTFRRSRFSPPRKSSRTPQGSAKVSTATTACLCLKTGVAVYPFILLSIDWAILTKALYPIHQNSTAESRRLYKSYDLFYPLFCRRKGRVWNDKVSLLGKWDFLKTWLKGHFMWLSRTAPNNQVLNNNNSNFAYLYLCNGKLKH